MVVKGKARGGAGSLAAHLLRTDHNERATLRELHGVVAEDLEGALREMAASVAEARSRRPFYHASINTRADELMTDAQKAQAIDRLEAELGFTGQPRAVQEHHKEGREHLHVVWLRIDRETMTAIPDSHNYRRHETVARELERTFGHERVQGAHIERDGVERPRRTPSLAEMMQAERSGIEPENAKAQLRALWERAEDGRSFAAALDGAGWTLARGDKRGFVALDPAGEVRSVNKDITGLTAAKLRDRLADLDPDRLPSVDQAREQRRTRQQEHAPEPRQEPHREAEAFWGSQERGKQPEAIQQPEKRPCEPVPEPEPVQMRDPAGERAEWAARLRSLAQPVEGPERASKEAEAAPAREMPRQPEKTPQPPEIERVSRLREMLDVARSRLSALGQRLDAAFQIVRERALRSELAPQLEPHRKTVAEAMAEWRRRQEPEPPSPKPQPERRRSVAEEMLEKARAKIAAERAAETPFMREIREQKERELSRSQGRERGMSRRHNQRKPDVWGFDLERAKRHCPWKGPN